jgi:hypothetical protein
VLCITAFWPTRLPQWVIFVRSTRSRRSRHVRFAPIASEPSHRSKSSRSAKSGRVRHVQKIKNSATMRDLPECIYRVGNRRSECKDSHRRQNAVANPPEIVPHLMAMPVLMRNNFYIDRQLAANMPVFDRKDEFYKPFAPLVYVH